MTQVKDWCAIFEKSIADYHIQDDVSALIKNPYDKNTIDHLLYLKSWIDTVQWHLEDIIRDPAIDPVKALEIKRTIDKSNQERTDVVEYIDSWLLQQYKTITPRHDARFNTESPAWAIDRLSILALKIYHMNIEANREDATALHRENSRQKLFILKSQQEDLITAIDELLADIAAGKKYMKVYKQMKMYNDEAFNPVLYKQKTQG